MASASLDSSEVDAAKAVVVDSAFAVETDTPEAAAIPKTRNHTSRQSDNSIHSRYVSKTNLLQTMMISMLFSILKRPWQFSLSPITTSVLVPVSRVARTSPATRRLLD